MDTIVITLEESELNKLIYTCEVWGIEYEVLEAQHDR